MRVERINFNPDIYSNLLHDTKCTLAWKKCHFIIYPNRSYNVKECSVFSFQCSTFKQQTNRVWDCQPYSMYMFASRQTSSCFKLSFLFCIDIDLIGRWICIFIVRFFFLCQQRKILLQSYMLRGILYSLLLSNSDLNFFSSSVSSQSKVWWWPYLMI